MNIYYVERKISDGMFSVNSYSYGQQLWVSCKSRKEHVCSVSRQKVCVGDFVIRPLGNPQNRMMRILLSVADAKCRDGKS